MSRPERIVVGRIQIVEAGMHVVLIGDREALPSPRPGVRQSLRNSWQRTLRDEYDAREQTARALQQLITRYVGGGEQ